jgi:hypothetical protein
MQHCRAKGIALGGTASETPCPAPCLQSLNLQSCEIGPAGAESLALGLAKQMCLKELNLADNAIRGGWQGGSRPLCSMCCLPDQQQVQVDSLGKQRVHRNIALAGRFQYPRTKQSPVRSSCWQRGCQQPQAAAARLGRQQPQAAATHLDSSRQYLGSPAARSKL